jgi:mono/diheme cytochrome c family protein
MKSNQSFRRTLSSLLAITALLALLTSCATYRSGQATPDSHGSAESATRLAKGGAQLWAENCARCHSFRSPGSYSDAQWDIAVHHMRIRANLTAEDSRKILAFLQAGN